MYYNNQVYFDRLFSLGWCPWMCMPWSASWFDKNSITRVQIAIKTVVLYHLLRNCISRVLTPNGLVYGNHPFSTPP